MYRKDVLVFQQVNGETPGIIQMISQSNADVVLSETGGIFWIN